MGALRRAYDLTFELRKGYLYSCVEAPMITRAMALDYLGEIAHKCAELRCKRLIIERDIPAVMPTPDALAAIAEFVRLNTNMRVAFVNRHASVGQPLRDIIAVGARSGADVAYFTSVRAAEKWLLHD